MACLYINHKLTAGIGLVGLLLGVLYGLFLSFATLSVCLSVYRPFRDAEDSLSFL